jgi:hypothetical protein
MIKAMDAMKVVVRIMTSMGIDITTSAEIAIGESRTHRATPTITRTKNKGPEFFQSKRG